jgi:hypothetical protein
MRLVKLIFIAMFVVVVGCDGDGDGDGALDSQEAPTDAGDTPDPGPQGVVLIAGSGTVGKADFLTFPFMVGETGTLEATVTWSAGSYPLEAIIWLNGFEDIGREDGLSPLSVSGEVTQDRLNQAVSWHFQMRNSNSVDIDVDYKLKFIPN